MPGQHWKIRIKKLIYSCLSWRYVPLALLLAAGMIALFPLAVSAHAILLRSDPPANAILYTAPQQVRMWFSEDLNPAFTTAIVINPHNQRVDKHDAHVSASDSKEMDVSLEPNLPPSVYIVIYRTDSADDGHILTGSFIFTLASPNGTVPTLNGNTIPGQGLLGGNPTGLYTGQLDGPTLFNLIAITLVEVGAIFWVGVHIWQVFVSQKLVEPGPALEAIKRQEQRRFERYWAIPALLVIFLANIGVLVGQGLYITGGQLSGAINPSLLVNLVTSGRFGTYWFMRECVVIVALLLALYPLLFRQRSALASRFLPLVNLALGGLLFIAISMSSHASAVSPSLVFYAVVADWLHLAAAAMWVGGMMYIATIYLPTLKHQSLVERVHSLITTLPAYSPLAITGVILMAVTGPFSAAVHLNSVMQLVDTAYGRALVVKIILVGALLLTSAFHVLVLRPRLAKEYRKYNYAVKSVRFHQAQQVKLREDRLAQRSNRLTTVLRWEPLIGVAVLVCVGLMNVFAGTLSPTALAQTQQPATNGQGYTTTARTTDGKYTIQLNINPNRFGLNRFTATVIDNSTRKQTSNVGVSLYTTMLDMYMGTDTVNLQPDGKGHFTALGDLSMPGNWEIRIEVRTPDNTVHEAIVKFAVPF